MDNFLESNKTAKHYIENMGATKKGEYYRTIELLRDIQKNQDLYFLLAYIIDVGYNRDDIKEMMKLMRK